MRNLTTLLSHDNVLIKWQWPLIYNSFWRLSRYKRNLLVIYRHFLITCDTRHNLFHVILMIKHQVIHILLKSNVESNPMISVILEFIKSYVWFQFERLTKWYRNNLYISFLIQLDYNPFEPRMKKNVDHPQKAFNILILVVLGGNLYHLKRLQTSFTPFTI